MYLNKNINELHELILSGEVTPIDLLDEAENRIKKSTHNSVIEFNREFALKQIESLSDIQKDSKLYGIPVIIKDNIATFDFKTTCASKMLEDYVSPFEATLVKKLKDAGAIIIAKANLDEFAMGASNKTSYFGPVNNPWDKSRVPGGSSGGSAASVALNLGAFSIGSDTGGSIRQPAAFCGIVGLKPTYGRVSRHGVVAFAASLDQAGPMTKSVIDNAITLNHIVGYDELDSTSIDRPFEDFTSLIGNDIKDMTIAYPKNYIEKICDNEVVNQFNTVVNYLESKGCLISEVEIPYIEQSVPLYQIIGLSEAASNLARFDGLLFGYKGDQNLEIDEYVKQVRTEGFGKEVKRRIMIGTHVMHEENSLTYLKKAYRIRMLITQAFQEIFSENDYVLMPTTTTTAFALHENLSEEEKATKSFYDDVLTIPMNMTGMPALSLPIGMDSQKLPIGMQIISDYFEESKIYQLASIVEKEFNIFNEMEVFNEE
jgi:aspartyl-tRNA(Asn)/glutamyl-tRNA(Gln) amidotransferase subunit A